LTGCFYSGPGVQLTEGEYIPGPGGIPSQEKGNTKLVDCFLEKDMKNERGWK
jgi:hypothetical protein